jgi:putative ABC transport system permease protein
MSDLWQDVRYGARLLRRSPGFAALIAAVLALGIGANSAIFSVVNAVLLRPLPYREPDRLVRVDETDPKGEARGVSPADMLLLAGRVPSFESIAVSRWQNLTLTGPEGAENVFGGLVSAAGFRMLGAQPATGRLFRDDEFSAGAPDAVILSARLWRRRFGASPSVLGKSLLMNGKPYTIAGVMPEDFLLDQRFELWTPWKLSGNDATQRGSRFTCIARLRRGATPQQAKAEVLEVLRQAAPDDAAKGWSARIAPLADQMTERVRKSLLVSLGAVAFVLLIACLNVANLLLSRATGRAREIAVRTALGAGRLRVVRQMLTESLLLALVGGGAGLVLGAWSARALPALFPERIPVPRLEQTRLDSQVFWFTLAISLASGILFGLLPALQATRGNLIEGLREGTRGTGSGIGARVRGLLVVAETALSLILLTGAGLMLRSFDRLMSVDPGFRADSALTLRVPMPISITDKRQQPPYYERILDRLRLLPGVNAAGLISPLPLAGVDANGTFAVEGRPAPPGERQLTKLRVVSADYFRAIGMQITRGRAFQATDGADAPAVAVISESLARKYFPGEDPVGRRITGNESGQGPYQTVVGVVKDVKNLDMAADFDPAVYRDFRQYFFAQFATTIVLRAQSGDPMRLAPLAQREIRALTPDQPVGDVKAMRQVVADSVSQPRFYTLLLSIYAALALLLAATGLYGVLAYSVSQRKREIGIRMALGAPGGEVFRLILSQSMRLVAAGVVIGLAGAWGLTRLIATELYRTPPVDPLIFGASATLMVAVAAIATWAPARRAVRVDPAIALRAE